MLSASIGGTVHAPINPNLSSLLSNRFVQIRKIQTKSHPVCSKVIVFKSCREISLSQCATCIFGPTDNGHPERAFFQKFETFGLGQTNWAEILWGIWGISGQTISTILALWVPCPWENVAGFLSYKKLWFLGLKHITPKCFQNKILSVKNLEKSLHTSVFGGKVYENQKCVK